MIHHNDRHKALRHLLSLLLLMFYVFLPQGLLAQKAIIKGVVTDANTQQEIYLAAVKYTHISTMKIGGAYTDSVGEFVLNQLDTGLYALEFPFGRLSNRL